MTREEILQRFPRASEAMIRANITAQAPIPCVSRPISPVAKGKTQAKPSKGLKRPSKVPKTRNGGTWSESAYWGHVRSALRRTFRFWKPAVNALNASRVPMNGPRGQKWAFLCAHCGKLHLRKNVQIDHVTPVGTLTDYSHIGSFIERLAPEDPKAYQILCSACHQIKTNKEREESKLVCP